MVKGGIRLKKGVIKGLSSFLALVMILSSIFTIGMPWIVEAGEQFL